MNTRRFASIALAAAVLLGATGCNMIAPQATTIPYSPADGVNVPDSGPLKVRNALFVSNEAGTSANFIAAIINDTDAPSALMVGIDGANKRVVVPAHTTVSLGVDDAKPLLFTGLKTRPGATIDVTFQSGDGEGVLQATPVLDGTLHYLADFVPAG